MRAAAREVERQCTSSSGASRQHTTNCNWKELGKAEDEREQEQHAAARLSHCRWESLCMSWARWGLV
jgi:hypothetical protein